MLNSDEGRPAGLPGGSLESWTGRPDEMAFLIDEAHQVTADEGHRAELTRARGIGRSMHIGEYADGRPFVVSWEAARRNGKTTLSRSVLRRMQTYRAQTGRRDLTPRQRRRLDKITRRALGGVS